MKLSGKKILLLMIALGTLVWTFAVSAMAPATPYGGAVVFGVASAVIAGAYLEFFHHPISERETESWSLPLIFSVGYVAAALLVNAGFALMEYGYLNKWMVTVNLLLLAGYVILVLYAVKSAQEISERTMQMEQSKTLHREIAADLGLALALAEEKEVRERLLRLKEMVDYSSNVTTLDTTDMEVQMKANLEELVYLLRNKKSSTEILEKIRTAEICWRARSSAASGR